MKTFKIMVNIGGRSQLVHINARNMLDARRSADAQYGKKNVIGTPLPA